MPHTSEPSFIYVPFSKVLVIPIVNVSAPQKCERQALPGLLNYNKSIK